MPTVPIVTPPQIPVNDSGEGRYLYDDGDGTRSWEEVAGGGGGSYTNEMAQDAVGGMAANSARVTLTYVDGTPSLTPDLVAGSITAGYLAASETDVLFGRSSSGAGAGQEIACTAAARSVLDDTTVAAMVDTLGGAAATGTGGLARAVSPAFTGTPTAPTASGGTNTTQIATTAFVSAAVSSAVAGLLDFKGNLDCSTNPNYPAASTGDTYYVSVAGKVGGASGVDVAVGDAVIAKADNAGGTEASVGTSWFVLEKNLDGALLTANALSELSGVAATARSNLGLVIGTDVQAFDADLSALAALSGTNTIYYRSAASTWTAVTVGSGLTFSGGTLSAGGGGGGITDVVQDTTPQLGGNLDLNTFTVGDATAADLTKLHALTPTATELNYVGGVTSAIQTQIDGKLDFSEGLESLGQLSVDADFFPYMSGTDTYSRSAITAAIRTFLATPSSANLISAVSDETGTGALVFANTPTLVTPAVGTASANDNSTRAASTAYVDAAVAAAVAGLLDFKGNLDASANPNYPAASKGDTYYVSVAGKVGGASGVDVAVGDAVIAKADNAGGTEASVGTSWFVLEKNLAGALLAANNLSDLASASTARTNLGVGTGDSPQFAAVNVGHATDTTITRVSAGVIAVEGATVLVSGGALGTPSGGTATNLTGLPLTTGVTGTLPIANGGTNLTTYTAGDVVYASATNVLGKLAIGAAGKVLTSIGGLPVYRDPAGDLTTATDGATVTFDLAVSRRYKVTLGGNRTFALSNDADGMAFTIDVLQDGTGGRTITFWSGVKWMGSTPTPNTGAGKWTSYAFKRMASGEYQGFWIAEA